MREQQIRDFLGGFDFRGSKVHDPLSTFSGGEKARLALAIVTFSRPNLLLLDEPTNHLDMDMRQALTIALQEFSGAILLVSHDRHLLANSVDTFLLVENGTLQVFDGDLEDYRRLLLGGQSSNNVISGKTKPQKQNKPNHRQARQLRSRLKTVETRLERLQGKLNDVDAKLAASTGYDQDQAENLQSLVRDQLGLKEEITILEEEWLEKTHELDLIKLRIG